MPSSSPIRLLICGSRRAPRIAVRAALQSCGADVSLAEVSRSTAIADNLQKSDANVLVLVHPELHELDAAYSVRAEIGPMTVIVVGRTGTRLVADVPGVDAYVPMNELYSLPQILRDLVIEDEPKLKLREKNSSTSSASASFLASDVLRESQKLISIGRLTAEISHEINNPLESVGNLLYLAQSEPHLTERAADYLRSAERELARVIQISKQTLSFYRESLKPLKIPMAELMEEVVALYSRRIVQKKLVLERSYRAGQSIEALPGEIRQVLSNLVTNAIEASSPDGRLYLRVQPSSQWRGELRVRGLRVSVADTGSGIPEAARKRLGELFFTTKGQSGTGLGLFVTRTILSRYGGTMQLRSRVADSSASSKHGTIFALFLPFDSTAVIGKPPAEGRRAKVTEISQHPTHANNHRRASGADRASSSRRDELGEPQKQRKG